MQGLCAYEVEKVDTKDVAMQTPDLLVEVPPSCPQTLPPMRAVAKKRVRIIKKVRAAARIWKFISLDRIGNRYVWDP